MAPSGGQCEKIKLKTVSAVNNNCSDFVSSRWALDYISVKSPMVSGYRLIKFKVVILVSLERLQLQHTTSLTEI